MTEGFDQRFRTIAWTGLRIAAGLTYFSHGTQKLLGWFGGFGPGGGHAELLTRFGAAGTLAATRRVRPRPRLGARPPLLTRFGPAGTIESIAGFCLILGLFTRPLAFIASGEMAVAYFWMHWGGSGQMWWWQNHGELVLLYSFIWLLYAAWGAGPYSLDARLKTPGRSSAPV